MPITLTYGSLMGLAQPIRLLLKGANVKFEDKQYDMSQFKTLWMEKDKIDFINKGVVFPSIPILTDDDFHVTQQGAILQYLGEKYLFTCDVKNLQKRAMINAYYNFGKDLWTKFWKALGLSKSEKDEDIAEKKKLHDELKASMETMSNKVFLKTSFVTGEKVSWADFYIFHLCCLFSAWSNEIADLEGVKKFMAAMLEKNGDDFKEYYEDTFKNMRVGPGRGPMAEWKAEF